MNIVVIKIHAKFVLRKEADHVYHIQLIEKRLKSKKSFFFRFLYFKARQNALVQSTEKMYLHILNLCVLHHVCTECIMIKMISNKSVFVMRQT